MFTLLGIRGTLVPAAQEGGKQELTTEESDHMSVYRTVDGGYEHEYVSHRNELHPDGPGEDTVIVRLTHSVTSTIKGVPAKERNLAHAAWKDYETTIPKNGQPAVVYAPLCWQSVPLQAPNLATATDGLGAVTCPRCLEKLASAQDR